MEELQRDFCVPCRREQTLNVFRQAETGGAEIPIFKLQYMIYTRHLDTLPPQGLLPAH